MTFAGGWEGIPHEERDRGIHQHLSFWPGPEVSFSDHAQPRRKQALRSQWKLTHQGKLEPRNYGSWRRNKLEKPSVRQAGGVGCSSGKWEEALPSLSSMADAPLRVLCALGWCLLLASLCLLQPLLVSGLTQAFPALACVGHGHTLAVGGDMPPMKSSL